MDLHASQNLMRLLYTVSQTFVATNLYLLLFLGLALNIYIVSLSGNLNKLNVLSTCHKVIPIKTAQSLELRLC